MRTVDEEEVFNAIKALKPKKSSGLDGVGQDFLRSIASVITVPLTLIINTSITSGVFPSPWKASKVVPVLKRGEPTEVSNYRPVSCLPAASKVLESVVEKQLRKYIEEKNILPYEQHGFRRGRSTVTTLALMVSQWSDNYEKGLNMGVLLYDLSAAFDTIDVNTF